jgi:hypothetical protein
MEKLLIAICVLGIFFTRAPLIWFALIFVTHFCFKYW